MKAESSPIISASAATTWRCTAAWFGVGRLARWTAWLIKRKSPGCKHGCIAGIMAAPC